MPRRTELVFKLRRLVVTTSGLPLELITVLMHRLLSWLELNGPVNLHGWQVLAILALLYLIE